MSHTVFLTAEEQKVTQSWPEAVRSGCVFEEEKMTFVDTDIQRASRMRTMTLESPELKRLQEEAKGKTYEPAELAAVADSLDLSSLSQNDLMELAFAWGPDVFSVLIEQAIPLVQSAEDAEAVASLTDVRHGLLQSLTRTH